MNARTEENSTQRRWVEFLEAISSTFGEWKISHDGRETFKQQAPATYSGEKFGFPRRHPFRRARTIVVEGGPYFVSESCVQSKITSTAMLNCALQYKSRGAVPTYHFPERCGNSVMNIGLGFV